MPCHKFLAGGWGLIPTASHIFLTLPVGRCVCGFPDFCISLCRPSSRKKLFYPHAHLYFMDYTLSQTVCLWGLLLGKKVCTWACSPAGLGRGLGGRGRGLRRPCVQLASLPVPLALRKKWARGLSARTLPSLGRPWAGLVCLCRTWA